MAGKSLAGGEVSLEEFLSLTFASVAHEEWGIETSPVSWTRLLRGHLSCKGLDGGHSMMGLVLVVVANSPEADTVAAMLTPAWFVLFHVTASCDWVPYYRHCR